MGSKKQNTKVGPYHKYGMNEWVSEVLSMLFECLDLWVPPVFRQGELALSSIQRRVDSVFEPVLGTVILQCSWYLSQWSIYQVQDWQQLRSLDRLLLLCDGNLQFRHMPATNKRALKRCFGTTSASVWNHAEDMVAVSPLTPITSVEPIMRLMSHIKTPYMYVPRGRELWLLTTYLV